MDDVPSSAHVWLVTKDGAFVKLIDQQGREPTWSDVPLLRILPAVPILFIVAFIPSVFWMAVVVSALWQWFVEPLGAPHVGVVTVIGVRLLAILVIGSRNADATRDRPTQALINTLIVGAWPLFMRHAIGRLVANFVYGLVVLGLGRLLLEFA